MSIATEKGDKGTTGLLFGGRVRKDSARIDCNGAVDEAQAAIGYARAVVLSGGVAGKIPAGELDGELVRIATDLWVLMAEVATAQDNRPKLKPGITSVTSEMVDRLTARVHEIEELDVMPKDFVVPGSNLVSAALDVARTIVRRAERLAVATDVGEGSLVVPYLNRLSDLCWLLARAAEAEHQTAKAATADRVQAD